MTQHYLLKVKCGLKAGIANPSSVFCEKNGGKSIIVRDQSGNEYGLCQFPDNRVYEEWWYFNTCSPAQG